MKTLDFDTLINLSVLLASTGWTICKYEVEGENVVSLKIVYTGKDKEEENG